ncbi:MAG: flagellar basal body P-ring formation protein FlgA [Chitinivibrionales bacterium]|nr:flagellar basal body P-ring formation protein FlgA [Chitinivibrionales bacterium]
MRRFFVIFSALFFFGTSAVAPRAQEILLEFHDSTTVKGTQIPLGRAAHIKAENPEKIQTLEKISIGESAPPGYARYLNPGEIVRLKLSKLYPTLTFRLSHTRRVNIATDFQEKVIGDFEQEIAGFIQESSEWDPGDMAVEIRNARHNFRLYNKPYTLSFSGLRSPFPRGPFRLQMLFVQGEKTFRIGVSCMAHVTTKVITAKQTIGRGERLGPHNCSVARKNISQYRYTPYSDIRALENRTTVRTIVQGSIISDKNTEKPPLVCKGDLVSIIMRRGPVAVAVDGRARENGSAGDRIWVENISSRKLVRGKIINASEVAIIRNREKET